jgi:uncharacterized protein
MVVKNEILKHLTDFKTLCQSHNVKYLYAFGSSTTDRFDSEKSDIDLLVEIDSPDPLERGEKLISLWDTFEINIMYKTLGFKWLFEVSAPHQLL